MNISYFEDGSVTAIFFNFDNVKYRQLPILFFQDKRKEYEKGSIATIPVHVREYTVDEQNVIWLEEWHNWYKSCYIIPP